MSILENFDTIGKNISDKATKTYKTVTKQSSKLIEEAKLRLQISSENDKISSKFEEIGSKVYESFKNGDLSYDSFFALCEEIEACEANIEVMNQRILELKKLRSCIDCSAPIAQNDAFCSKCGSEQPKYEEKIQEKVIEKDNLCPNCNSKLAKGDIYCSSCGAKVNE